MKSTTLLFVGVCVFLNSFGIDKIEFEKLNSNDGLSSEEIRNIFQDKEGYLWFLTPEGLNRFDGYDFKIYKPGTSDLGFTSAAFESICQDHQGRIWLGTPGNGLLIFDTKNNLVSTFEEFSKGQQINDQQIRTLATDKNNNIWIGTEYGLYKFDIEVNKLSFFNLGDLDSPTPAWCIVESILNDTKGNTWVGTWNMGLFIFDNETGQIENHNIFNASTFTSSDNRIKTLFEDNNKNIWVGTWEDGLYRVKKEGSELNIQVSFLYDETNKQSILGDIIYSIQQDNSGNLWIGTPYGLSIIENPNNDQPLFTNYSYIFGNNDGLSNNEVWKILKDKSGLMWLGTLEGGINKINPSGKAFDGYSIPPVNAQINSQTVQSFCTDKNDQLIIGVKSLGFGKYDLESRKYVHYMQLESFKSLPPNINTVICLLNEDNRYLWLGTRYSGLILYDYETQSALTLNTLNEAFTYETVNDIFLDKHHNAWAGTDVGLFRIQRCDTLDDCFSVEKIAGIGNKQVVSVSEDSNGNIWVGTAENGLIKIEDIDRQTKYVTFQKSEDNIPTDRIHCIYIDSNDKLWVGTADQGLLFFDETNDSFNRATITKGSKSEMIFGITEDAKGNLWLTTNKGLTRLIINKDKLIADSYTVADGLQGNTFVKGSIFRQSDNRIFIGGYYGFNAFYPSEVKPNPFVPPTVITDVLVNGKVVSINGNEPKILSYNENNLSIKFSALSYLKPDKNTFSYKLDGFNDDWQFVDATSRIASFPKLEAGEYTFYLQAANSSELWNKKPVVIHFKVLPAPYKTWWAYLGYALGSLLVLVLIYRSLLNNEKVKRALEIEKIEHAKSEKLNQFKLRFFTNISHELLTPLSVISCSIDIIKLRSRSNKEELKIIDRNINQLNRLLHQLLDFRKTESGHLKLKVDSGIFKHYVRHITSNFESLAMEKNISINMNLTGPENLSYFDADIVDKILDNLLSNSIKYTPEGGSILVSSRIINHQHKGQFAELNVSDTGIGIPQEELNNIFNRFYRLEAGEEDTGTGIGLAFTKSLVELHKGNIEVESEPGKGTTFRVILPIGKENFTQGELTSKQHQLYTNASNSTQEKIKPLSPSQLNMIKRANIKLMIVDDNNDFRSVLKFHFKKMYGIIEAADGEMALKKAVELSPDIIVSDVLMPKKDGIELCIDLKNNVDTKNIPVILLTAKKGEEERLKGYKAGADSYIAKPVSLQILESRINALLMKRPESNPGKLAIYKNSTISKRPPDHLFVKNVEQYIIENISDSGLTIKTIARHFAMSDSMLFRRLKKLTALPPVEFVKRVRLNQSAILLKAGDISIADVAYKMGFSDQSYFTACFKKQFGSTPGVYVRTNAKQAERQPDYQKPT